MPAARRTYLQGLSTAQLDAEEADIRKWLDHHAVAESFNVAARLAADALRDSLRYVLQIRKERLYSVTTR